MDIKVTIEHLQTATRRKQLDVSKEPYWLKIAKGLSIGFYKSETAELWRCRKYVNGEYIWTTLGDVADLEYDEAVELAHKEGKKKVTKSAKKFTVEEACEAYLNTRETEGKNNFAVKATLQAYIQPKWGGRKLTSINASEVESWKQELSQDRKPATVNRILGDFRAILNQSASVKHIDNSAWMTVDEYEVDDDSRKRVLTKEEQDKLVECAEPDMRALIQAGLLTGCRLGELRPMLVKDFDSRKATVFIPKGKTKKSRRDMPLSDAALLFFQQQVDGKKPTDFIFQDKDGNPEQGYRWERNKHSHKMNRAIFEAGLDGTGVTFYSTRHTFATELSEHLPIHHLAQIMGTSVEMLSDYYTHQTNDDIRRRMNQAIPQPQEGRVVQFKR